MHYVYIYVCVYVFECICVRKRSFGYGCSLSSTVTGGYVTESDPGRNGERLGDIDHSQKEWSRLFPESCTWGGTGGVFVDTARRGRWT